MLLQLIIIMDRTLIEGIGCRRKSTEVIKFDGKEDERPRVEKTSVVG